LDWRGAAVRGRCVQRGVGGGLGAQRCRAGAQGGGVPEVSTQLNRERRRLGRPFSAPTLRRADSDMGRQRRGGGLWALGGGIDAAGFGWFR
jgi:hypothetical protein